MRLTKEEREFLDAYVYEATHEPFGGPATDDLRRRGIYYADLHGMITAYHQEVVREKSTPMGKFSEAPPSSPWATREEAERRNRSLMATLDSHKSIALGSDAASNAGSLPQSKA